MKYLDYRKKLVEDEEFLKTQEQLRLAFNFGDAVLRARIEKGWSQTELARYVGTRQANISRLESGVANPTMRLMQNICRALDLEFLTVPRMTASDHHIVNFEGLRQTANFATLLKDILSKSEGKGFFRLCQHKIGVEHGEVQYFTEFNWNRSESIYEQRSISKSIAEKGVRYWVEFCKAGSNHWEKVADWPFFDEPEHLVEKA